MKGEELEARWREVTGEVARGMREWREAHLRASLREIETALDEQWARARAQIVAEAAEASAVADVRAAQAAGQAVSCRACGVAVTDQGQQSRTLRTQGDQKLRLKRSYAVCPACGAGHFPPG